VNGTHGYVLGLEFDGIDTGHVHVSAAMDRRSTFAKRNANIRVNMLRMNVSLVVVVEGSIPGISQFLCLFLGGLGAREPEIITSTCTIDGGYYIILPFEL
jgi:hypothetical protein